MKFQSASHTVVGQIYKENVKKCGKQDRKQRLYEESKTKKAIHLTLITTYALKQNKYSGIVQNVITAEQLMSV